MKTRSRQVRGFTLIEMMAVVLIIAVLVALTVSVSRYASEKSKESRAKAELAALELAIESFRLDQGYYPTSSIVRLSYQPYHMQTNSWMLYQQLVGGPKKYINFRSDQLVRDGNSGVTYIVDPWGSPIVYYRPASPVTYQAFSVTDDRGTPGFANDDIVDFYTVGGQVNVASYDLFSYGSDKITHVPGAPSPWNSASAATDDIWSGR